VREFQANLTPTQTAELLERSRSNLDATAILAFTAQIDKVNASRRSRCVSSRLFGILQSVQEFSGIADTFVSAHPEIAALVLGSLKVTILVLPAIIIYNDVTNASKALNNIVSFFDKLSEVFLRLGSCCPRFTQYQFLFTDSVRLQNALCAFYATIVNFCTKAVQALNKPGASLFHLTDLSYNSLNLKDAKLVYKLYITFILLSLLFSLLLLLLLLFPFLLSLIFIIIFTFVIALIFIVVFIFVITLIFIIVFIFITALIT
jgi:hypothetical protein